jgi:hypothetical protein
VGCQDGAVRRELVGRSRPGRRCRTDSAAVTADVDDDIRRGG